MDKFILWALLFLISINANAAVITHGGTLPDSAQKTDFYAIIDSATISAITNADISSSAAILASKLDLTSPGSIGTTVAGVGDFTTLGVGVASARNLLDVQGTVNLNSLEVLNNGNVGIGSLNPSSTLDVQGTVRVTSLTITTGNLGIGSVNPGFTLDVGGTVRSKGFFVNGYNGMVGARNVSQNVSTIYQASTDLFVYGSYGSCSGGTPPTSVNLLSDSSATPVTAVSHCIVDGDKSELCNVSGIVRKSDYYEITFTSSGTSCGSAVSSIAIGS